VIGEVARAAMAPFKALIDKLTRPKPPEPPRLSQAEAIKKAMASPILGLSGKPPRSIATVEVPGPGPEWFQERERRRRQAEEAADRRQEQKVQKEAAERAAKVPRKPQELPEDNGHPDVGGGIKRKH